MSIIRGFMVLSNGTPADLIANSSKRSPKLPNTMIEASNIESGRARGIRFSEAYKNISPRTLISKPFPTISSIYFQRNCISTKNKQMTNVIENNGRKDCRIKLYSLFKRNIFFINTSTNFSLFSSAKITNSLVLKRF